MFGVKEMKRKWAGKLIKFLLFSIVVLWFINGSWGDFLKNAIHCSQPYGNGQGIYCDVTPLWFRPRGSGMVCLSMIPITEFKIPAVRCWYEFPYAGTQWEHMTIP
jgi:hypothetical protein